MKVVCLISNANGGQTVCVRERKDVSKTVELLGTVLDRLTQLVAHLKQRYPHKAYVKRLVENFNLRTIEETLPTSKYVAYTEDKGAKMAFCTTTKKNGRKLIDVNTLMYVAIHELAHIATESIGHTDEFWSIFKAMLIEAAEVELYEPQDYRAKPVEYGGMTINENIYYDDE